MENYKEKLIETAMSCLNGMLSNPTVDRLGHRELVDRAIELAEQLLSKINERV